MIDVYYAGKKKIIQQRKKIRKFPHPVQRTPQIVVQTVRQSGNQSTAKYAVIAADVYVAVLLLLMMYTMYHHHHTVAAL